MKRDKKRYMLIGKALLMLIGYGTAIAVIEFLLPSENENYINRIIWGIWMIPGVWQCYRWLDKKLEAFNDSGNKAN